MKKSVSHFYRSIFGWRVARIAAPAKVKRYRAESLRQAELGRESYPVKIAD